ncbi:MAG: DUF3014 domain-containing protein [Gammaproteobacteria bacterium]
MTERKRPLGSIIMILIVLLAIGGGVWLYYKPEPVDDSSVKTQELPVPSRPETSAVESEQAVTEAVSPGAGEQNQNAEETQGTESGTQEIQETTPAALPSLENSDGFVRDRLADISPGLKPWLKTDGLIRKIVVIGNDFSQGQRLYQHMKAFKLSEPFIAEEDEQGLYITRKSYQRYNALASAIDAISVPEALDLYKKIKPLCQQVFAEFDYPADYQLDDLMKKAASELLAAPVIESRIDLVRTSVNYKFADQELEALSPVHKQMIRMGPQNTRIIQNKLRLLMEALVNLDD